MSDENTAACIRSSRFRFAGNLELRAIHLRQELHLVVVVFVLIIVSGALLLSLKRLGAIHDLHDTRQLRKGDYKMLLGVKYAYSIIFHESEFTRIRHYHYMYMSSLRPQSNETFFEYLSSNPCTYVCAMWVSQYLATRSLLWSLHRSFDGSLVSFFL